jgi:RNA polymerase sigma-70 factor (ECF subfamily)
MTLGFDLGKTQGRIMRREVSDKQSIELILQGGNKREEGISLLFRRYAPELRRFFAYQCGNRDEADDLVQETFIKIVRFIGSHNQGSSVQAWIWTIGRNCLTDHFRYKGTHPVNNLDEDGWAILEQTSMKMRVDPSTASGDNIEDCIRQQFVLFSKGSPDAAYALNLQMDGHDVRYIANTLQRSEGATRQFLSQCRKKIESFLSPCRDYLTA